MIRTLNQKQEQKQTCSWYQTCHLSNLNDVPILLKLQHDANQLDIIKTMITSFHFLLCRLVGDAWGIDPSIGGCSWILCQHYKRWYRGLLHMPRHWLLPDSGAHPSIRRLQKLIHQEQWYLEQHRHHSSLHLPGLGLNPLLVDTPTVIMIFKEGVGDC